MKKKHTWYQVEKQPDGSVKLFVPVFGDYIKFKPGEYEESKDIVEEKMADMLKARLFSWLIENYPRCVSPDKWSDLSEEKLKLQLCIHRCLSEMLGLQVKK